MAGAHEAAHSRCRTVPVACRADTSHRHVDTYHVSITRPSALLCVRCESAPLLSLVPAVRPLLRHVLERGGGPEALPAGVVLLHLNTPIYISPARRRLAELTDARDKGVCKERDGAHRVVSNAAIQNLVDCPSQV